MQSQCQYLKKLSMEDSWCLSLAEQLEGRRVATTVRQPAASPALHPEKLSGQHLSSAHLARPCVALYHIKQNKSSANRLTFLTFSCPFGGTIILWVIKTQNLRVVFYIKAWQHFLCQISSNHLKTFSFLFFSLKFPVKLPNRLIFLTNHLSHLTPLLLRPHWHSDLLQFLKARSAAHSLNQASRCTDQTHGHSVKCSCNGIQHFTNFLLGSYMHRSLWTTNYKINITITKINSQRIA